MSAKLDALSADAMEDAPAPLAAASNRAAPAPQRRGLFERAKEALSPADKSSDEKSKAVRDQMPEPPTQPPTTAHAKEAPTTTLAAFADRLRALLGRLDRGEARDDIADDLRLLIEEAAHAGIAPATRKPLQDALAALQRGDVHEVKRLLEPLATPAPHGFWK